MHDGSIPSSHRRIADYGDQQGGAIVRDAPDVTVGASREAYFEACFDGARVEGQGCEVTGSVAVIACCRRATSASLSATWARFGSSSRAW